MSAGKGAEASLAGAFAAVMGEVVIHPMDTIITRMQSAVYRQRFKHVDGSVKRILFAGLYQGFGPTLVASVPASAIFFAGYEAAKAAIARAQAGGHLAGMPQPVLDAASSVGAELAACAIANPAEVLKQNAQAAVPAAASSSPTADMVRRFRRRPSRLWTGYWTLVASQLPGVCLTMGLYEHFKAALLRRQRQSKADSMARQLEASALGAALAGGCSSCVLVPVDVVKTRMRLAAGDELHAAPRPPAAASRAPPTARRGGWAVARDVLRAEGVVGLFRGSLLTCLAATTGSAVYFGCYEGGKLLLSGG